eukprot:sb/3475521/
MGGSCAVNSALSVPHSIKAWVGLGNEVTPCQRARRSPGDLSVRCLRYQGWDNIVKGVGLGNEVTPCQRARRSPGDLSVRCLRYQGWDNIVKGGKPGFDSFKGWTAGFSQPCSLLHPYLHYPLPIK